MSAIVGLVSRDPRFACEADVRRMLSAVARAGQASDIGMYSDPDAGVYVGWAGDAPGAVRPGVTVDPETGAVLVIAGELAEPASDSSVLHLARDGRRGRRRDPVLEMYARKGNRFVADLNGCFAGVLIDTQRETACLFNDRYGMKRLFVHEPPDRFLFATEAKAILAVESSSRSFDEGGLAEWFAYGCTLGERSLFNGIGILPAASILAVDQRTVGSRESYFDRVGWEEQSRLEDQDFTAAFVEMASRIIRDHAYGGSRPGISLTGGLDSRMVVSCLNPAAASLPCYTFGSAYRDTFDVQTAREIARRLRQEHTVLTLGRDFLDRFPEYMSRAVYCSEGYIGMSGAAELYLNEAARKISPVRVTGNYGSELLRGARAFKAEPPGADFLVPPLAAQVAEAAARFDDLESVNPVSFTLFWQAPHYGYGRRRVEESQLTVRNPFLDDRLVRLMYRAPAGYGTGESASIALIAAHRPDLLEVPTDRGLLGRGSRLTQLVRRAYREALFKGEYWASHGMPQWLAATVRVLGPVSPLNAFVGRHKFQHFGRWLRHELAAYVQNTVASAGELSKFLEPRAVVRLIEDHVQARRNFEAEIDSVVTIAVAARELFRDPDVNADDGIWMAKRPASAAARKARPTSG